MRPGEPWNRLGANVYVPMEDRVQIPHREHFWGGHALAILNYRNCAQMGVWRCSSYFGALVLLTLTAYYSTTVPSALDAAITRIWVLFHLRSLKSPKFSCLGFQNFHNFFQKTNFNSFVLQVSLTKSSPLKLRPCGAIQICLFLLLLFFWPRYSIPGNEKITLCNTKNTKIKLEWTLLFPLLKQPCRRRPFELFIIVIIIIIFKPTSTKPQAGKLG